MNKNLKIALILLDSCWLSNIDKTAILDTFEFKSISKIISIMDFRLLGLTTMADFIFMTLFSNWE